MKECECCGEDTCKYCGLCHDPGCYEYEECKDEDMNE